MAAAEAGRTCAVVNVVLVLFFILLSCAKAFVDIRAPERDAAVLEAQPQTQVHLVFSSHLVRCKTVFYQSSGFTSHLHSPAFDT